MEEAGRLDDYLLPSHAAVADISGRLCWNDAPMHILTQMELRLERLSLLVFAGVLFIFSDEVAHAPPTFLMTFKDTEHATTATTKRSLNPSCPGHSTPCCRNVQRSKHRTCVDTKFGLSANQEISDIM